MSGDLQRELGVLDAPLDDSASDSEIRVAQAQLVGWLEGLMQGFQAALLVRQAQAHGGLKAPGDAPRTGNEADRLGLDPGQYL